MADRVITSTGPCDCCGSAGCFLTMPTTLIDGTTTPYADSTAAAAALADQAASGCYMEGSVMSFGASRTTFSSAFASSVLTLLSDATLTSFAPAFLEDYILTRVYLTAADGLSIDYNMALTHPGMMALLAMVIELYEDDGTTLVATTYSGPTDLAFVGTWAPTIPADGYYYIKSFAQVAPDSAGTQTTSIALDITGGASLIPCTVQAAYGGTPDYLVCT